MEENKVILSEINRMRQIMGLKLIMEATVPPAVRQALLDFMGFTEKQIDALERSAGDFSDLSKLSDEFATLGIKNLDDLQRHVAQEMGIKSLNDVSDDVILKYMKQSPEIMQGVTKKLNSLVADAADAIIKKADWQSIVGGQAADEFEFILRQPIDAENAADVKMFADNYKGIVDTQIADAVANGRTVPDSLRNLSEELGEKSKQADNINIKQNKDFSQVPGDKNLAKQDGENAMSDAEKEYREKQKEIDAQKEYETMKNTQIDDLLSKLGGSEAFQKAFSAWQKLMEKIGFGGASRYLDAAKKAFGQKTLTQLEDPKILDAYYDELYTIAKGKLGKEGATSFIKKLRNFSASLDDFFKSIPFIGRFYKLFSAICGLATLFFAKDNIPFVGETLDRTGREIWDGADFISIFPEFEKTFPYCFYEIKDYSNLTDEQQIQFQGLGFNCDNIDTAKPDMLITKITYQNENRAMNTPEGFNVTVGGTERLYQPNSSNTNNNSNNNSNNNTSQTYTNDPTGYKKYVEDKGGTYGASGNYVMEDGTPFYKDSDGNWQAGSYNGTTFVTN
jgi:hypothetical protein